jgi:filamentous hemagglutinin family protein
MPSIVISLTVFGILTCCGTGIAIAQVRPDNALGNEKSVLNSNVIEGGAQRGSNLFHSFQEFSIGAGQRIDFANPSGVNNILTRVTDAPSSINGILGVLGNANLFLINPNGISFGTEARLDLAGTFVGSTANGIKFSDGLVYGVDSPAVALLTTTVPVGLQFGSQPSGISLKDSTNLLARDAITNYGGSSFLLIGGDINLTNSRLVSPESKIELVAIAGTGSIGIDPFKLLNPRELSVTVPAGLTRSDITIKDGSVLNTSGAVSGAVGLQARNIEISRTADTIRSVINTRSTGLIANDQGGNVTLNATNDVSIVGDFSGISTSPQLNSKINGGDITIKAQNLRILDGAYLETSPFIGSTGAGGNISIDVTNTITIGAPGNGEESDIIASSFGAGDSGNINIYTNRLLLKDGAQIFTDNSGTSDLEALGKLGNITIIAREFVDISGVSRVVTQRGFPKSTGITAFTASKKDAGNIDIQTPKFSLRDGAVLSAGTDNTGAGGNISIAGIDGQRAASVELSGNSNLSGFLGLTNVPDFANIGNGSRIRSITSSSGNAGNIAIKADRLTLQGGTRIDVSTIGSGAGGSIDIQSETLELADGGQLISTTSGSGSGRAGNINVRSANAVNAKGIDNQFATKRAFFSLITTANNQLLARRALTSYLTSPSNDAQQLFMDYWSQNNGNAEDKQILLKYFSLLAQDSNARKALQDYIVRISTNEDSPDYNLFLNTSNASGLVSRSRATSTGDSGNIVITSPSLNISQGATVTANGDGSGQGGSIVVNAQSVRLERGSITAKTVAANGGNIGLNIVDLLLLRNQSEISTSAAANGNGGNITIQAPAGVVVAAPRDNSDITASAIGGRGGTVKINALSTLGFSFLGLDDFSNIAATSTAGLQGTVTVTNLDADPSRGLQSDPIIPGAPSLSQACPTGSYQSASTLIDSGSGGVTPRPSDALFNSDLWSDARANTNAAANLPLPTPTTIIAAQGWKIGSNRTVTLTSQASPAIANSATPNCHAR